MNGQKDARDCGRELPTANRKKKTFKSLERECLWQEKSARDQHLPTAGTTLTSTRSPNTAGAYNTHRQDFTLFFSTWFLLRVHKERDHAKYSPKCLQHDLEESQLGETKRRQHEPAGALLDEASLCQAWQCTPITDQALHSKLPRQTPSSSKKRSRTLRRKKKRDF